MYTNISEGYGCLLAPMVVNAVNTTTVPVWIFKPHHKPIVVRQDSVARQVEPVKVEHAIAKHENPSEIGNNSAARHATLRERTEPKVKCICQNAKLSSTDSLLQERQTFRSLFLHCLSTQRACMSNMWRIKVKWSVHRFTAFCWNMKMYSPRMTMTWAIPAWLNTQLTLGMKKPLSSHLDGCQ